MLNSLLNEKILDRSTFKAFADNKISVIIKLECVLEWVESIVEGVNAAWFPAFSPFPTMFSNGVPLWVIKSWRPLHISILSWSSFKQYSAHYSFQVDGCFPK